MSIVNPGSHVCLLYDDLQKHWEKVLPIIEESVRAHEQVVYAVDESTREEARGAILAYKNALFEPELTSGQILVLTPKEGYLRSGTFDPDQMIQFIDSVMQEAIARGFEGFLGIGEMTWIFAETPGSERLIEYESKLNKFTVGKKIRLVCEYNTHRFSPELLKLVLRTHPYVMDKGGADLCDKCLQFPLN